MNKVSLPWTAVESKSALESAVANEVGTGELLTADPNEWGFFRLPNGKVFVVGYANLGLMPIAVLIGNRLLVGIDEVLDSFDIDTGQRKFSYRMPSVFHEFISLADPIVVRDEIGFVAISADGEEFWSFVTSGPIRRFSIDHGMIHGETIDDEPFEFTIPSQFSRRKDDG